MPCTIHTTKQAADLVKSNLSRRTLVISISSLLTQPFSLNALARNRDVLDTLLPAIEQRLSARLGVFLEDLETNRKWVHRSDERFPMCSTFKGLAGGALLSLVDQGKDDINRKIVIQPSDILSYAPITKARIGGEGMTLGEICEATITTSDNTAGNLLLKAIGGPEGFTRFVRSMGDQVTRLDRWEPDLNESKPGDPRDSTTPVALSKTMQTLLFSDALSLQSRKMLTSWLIGNKVGDTKVRAGLPKDWLVGDKTGGGAYGTNNDTGVIWPIGRKPILFTIMMTETSAFTDEKNAAMAEIARTLKTAITG